MFSTVPEPTAQTDQVFTDHTLFRFNQSLVVGCEKKTCSINRTTKETTTSYIKCQIYDISF